MKKVEFYVVTWSYSMNNAVVELKNGYEDDKCFYHKDADDPEYWKATDKNTGLRLASRKTKKELSELIHSEVFDRIMKEKIAVDPKRYETLCDLYKSAVDSKSHIYKLAELGTSG